MKSWKGYKMTSISPDELRKTIKQGPHMRVVIKPRLYIKEHIKTLKECWNIMEISRVSLKGWDYPHVDRENRAYGNDWIASWCEVEGYQEYWRLYQSAQFVQLRTFIEDAHPEYFHKGAIHFPEGFSPNGYLDFIRTLFTITELFEFTSRLAQKGILGKSVLLTIQMVNIQNRILCTMDPMRIWTGFNVSTENTLTKELTISTEILVRKSEEKALEVTIGFFERFGCMDILPEILIKEQRKLLEKRL